MKKSLFSLLLLLPLSVFSQVFFEENFNSTQLPSTWTVQQSNPRESWKVIEMASGLAAGVEYDDDLENQNEWLISPSLNFAEVNQNFYTLKFKAGFSAYWSINPYDHYDMFVKVSTDNGATWNQIWTETDLANIAPNFGLNNITLDVSQYASQSNVKFAFVYEGADGAGFYVDDVLVEASAEAPPVVIDYCAPGEYFFVEAITNVTFAGINNTTSASSTVSHEYFLNLVGNVEQGETYEIRLSGNTEGDFENKFHVFIDWNQNGSFEENEHIEIEGFLENSTGTDGVFLSQNIVVPEDAVLGNTRMRVKKYYYFDETDYDPDPCNNAGYFGQLEDYTINVSPSEDLGLSQVNKITAQVYPNPVVDFLSIKTAEEIKAVTINDVSGRLISTAKFNSKENKVDLSGLASGIYVIKIETDKGFNSFKVIKK